jgi:glucokinase
MIIGVDCGATFIKAGIVVQGKVIKQIKIKTQSQRGKKASLNNLIMAIRELFSPKIKGIGIGFPAPVDTKKGLIREVNNMPGWSNVALKRIIETKFKVPCRIDNDANCFVLAEYIHGSCQNHKNIIGITLGTGIGMGIIINGKLYTGATYTAGEINRIPYNNQWIEKIANISFFKKTGKTDPADIYERMGKNKLTKKDIRLLALYGRNLGKILLIAIYILDPEIMVLGGGLSHFLPYFKKSMMKEIKKNCYRETYKKLKIIKSDLEDAAILGAAELFK